MLENNLSVSISIRRFSLLFSVNSRPGVGQAIAPDSFLTVWGGKSGLHRTECQVTPGGREPTESAAENKPPAQAGKGEMVR